jgi:hypothetical protein
MEHRPKRRWRDLSTRQKTAILVGAALQFLLAGIAVNDLARRPAAQVRGPKWAWAPAMAVNFFGPIAYLRWGRVRRAPAPPATSVEW